MADKQDGTERLGAFTDGVLAISMTLLALDVRLPIDVSNLDNAALWAALDTIKPRLFSYGLSFLVVASFWVNHRSKFRTLSSIDAVFIWLNMIFLMVVGLVPFATGVLADSGNAVATGVYASVMALSSIMLGIMTLHARQAGLMISDNAAPMVRARFGVAAVFLLSIPVAFWNEDLGKWCWLLLIPLSQINRWQLQLRQSRS